MKIHTVKQGSPEWRELRHYYFTASEAPAMMGCGYISRNDLLNQKALGTTEDIKPAQQALFDRGHTAEAAYRPHAAQRIGGGDLYPITASIEVDGLQLLASSDGVTMAGDVGFEHKLYNAELAAMVAINGEPGPKWYWQLEHQILVLGVEHILFVTSDGTPYKCESCFYESKPERRAALIAGWKQFAADLDAYQPQAEAPQKVVGVSAGGLLSLVVDVKGEVSVASNWVEFRAAANAFIERLKKPIETDQDFADAEVNVKSCEGAEERLAALEGQVLGRVSSIDEVVRLIRGVAEEIRAQRLNLERTVKFRKDSIKAERIAQASADLATHWGGLNVAASGLMPPIAADFAGAAKNKRTIKSLQDALDQALADAKARASTAHQQITSNLELIRGEAHEFVYLFPDLRLVCTKSTEDFVNLLNARRAEEEIRLEKAQQEARQGQQAAAPAPAPQAAVVTAEIHRPGVLDSNPVAQNAPAEPTADSSARINLSRVNAILTPVTLTVAGLTELGFPPVEIVRSSSLYREADIPAICAAIARHVGLVASCVVQPSVRRAIHNPNNSLS